MCIRDRGAGEAPILHNAASVAANAWNLPAALDYAKQWARNTFTGDYAPIDVNTPAQTMNIYRDAVRDETGRNIEEGLGGGLAGKAASFAYQTGMSWADSLATVSYTHLITRKSVRRRDDAPTLLMLLCLPVTSPESFGGASSPA